MSMVLTDPAQLHAALGASSGTMLSAADSARSVAQLYTVALLATVPIALTAAAALALRRAPAGTRALVWRSATVALLVIYVGHLLPVQWIAGVVPAGLAAPLVSLGELQLAVAKYAAPVYRALGTADEATGADWGTVVSALIMTYWAGVVVVLLPVVRAWVTTRATARAAAPVRDRAWKASLDEARAASGVERHVRVLVSPSALVPHTCGVVRPVIVVPRLATRWSATHRRAALLHELAHVRAGDVAFALAARVACALFWFHPASWWIARRLREECELACDDRVLGAGVRASDYAELLVRSADAARLTSPPRPFATALADGGGLRQRLAAIVESRRDIGSPGRRSVACAAALTIAVSGPLGAVRLAPTRDVLTTLMRDTRWETRAYAVMGLAQRPDSVEVARAAAELDPSPRVRAWARFALGRASGSQELPSLLHELPARPADRR